MDDMFLSIVYVILISRWKVMHKAYPCKFSFQSYYKINSRQHELFLTRQSDILPATHIRGKCVVTQLSEVETVDMYLKRDVTNEFICFHKFCFQNHFAFSHYPCNDEKLWPLRAMSYLFVLSLQDVFFYSLVYDPNNSTLLADKGEIRQGDRYQCEVSDDMEPDAVVEDNKENGFVSLTFSTE